MVGIPYDDLKGWRGPYPAEIFAAQFEKVAQGWQLGLPDLQRAVEKTPPELAESAQAELRFATAAQLHFRSVANQTRFVLARDALADAAKSNDAEKTQRLRAQIRAILDDEIDCARRLYTLTRADARIGYEASNHYYYIPADLVEKVINCRYLKQYAFKPAE
jgi:hypothetical protein